MARPDVLIEPSPVSWYTALEPTPVKKFSQAAADFVPWTVAHFQTEAARDRFLGVVATRQMTEIEVQPLTDDQRGVRLRWRPGHFLELNDVAYAHGGRIIVRTTRRQRIEFNH